MRAAWWGAGRADPRHAVVSRSRIVCGAKVYFCAGCPLSLPPHTQSSSRRLPQACSDYRTHLSAFCSAFWRSSSMSMLPLASVLMATIFMPAMMADAGFVPCADLGMMHTCAARLCEGVSAAIEVLCRKLALELCGARCTNDAPQQVAAVFFMEAQVCLSCKL